MEEQIRVSAVIVAAGSSRRMGFDKLSCCWQGKTVLARSLEAFDSHPMVEEIILVTGQDQTLAARLAGAWGGNERGGRGQAPPLRVSVERGEQRTSVPVCPHISGAGKEKERRPKWAAFGKQLRT